MPIHERAKNCEKYELEQLFNMSKNLKNDLQHSVFISLIKRAEELECFDFIFNKMSEYTENKNVIKKIDNEILKVFLHANIRTENAQRSIEIFENFKIEYEFSMKNKLLNYFSYTYIHLKNYKKSIEILEKIKNEKIDYFENYIDVLILDKQYEKSLSLLKNYSPKKDRHKIWKSMILAEIYYKNDDLKKLEVYYKKALSDFLKYRVTKDIIEHSAYYYCLGTYAEKLNDLKSAKNFFENSVNFPSSLLIELEYKKKAKSKLEKMEGIL